VGVGVTTGNRVPLQGAVNVRDLGGYRTTDGCIVSRGVLFRGDGLSKLTENDLIVLGDMALRTVIDFRTPGEVLSLGPDRLPLGPVAVTFPVGSGDLSDIYDLVSSGQARRQHLALGEGRADAFMASIYRSFVSDARSRERFGSALSLICDDAVPALFHCTGGKDRTGWMAAVILLALGVPLTDVVDDYLLSNHYLGPSYAQLRLALVKAGLLGDPELMRPIMEVRSGYLRAGFDEAERLFGSFGDFLTRGLGMDRQRLSKLRGELLISGGGRG
jgi:protein-tyrosine phosphatase